MRSRVVWRRTADLDTGEVLEDIPVVGMCRNELSRKLDRPRKLKVEFFGENEIVPSSRDVGHVSSSLDADRPVIQAIQRASEGITLQCNEVSYSSDSNQALDRPEYDEYTGILLPKDLVRQAKKDELDFVRSKRVWRVVPRSHAGRRRIIGTRWVSCNKGDELHPEIRCRLVAQEIKTPNATSKFYAATPPVETLRLILSHAAESEQYQVSLVDVSRAYFNVEAEREV